MASAEYKLAIKIAGSLDKSFSASINGAQKQLGALGTLGKIGGASLKIASSALSALGSGALNAATASVETGKEFEAAMSSAAATANANTEEYAKMEAAAMEMGRSTSKTATESANALEYMSLAGWDVDTSIAALPSVLKMSEASGMDLARCSDIVTDSMSAAGVKVNGFSVGVNGLSDYLDIATRAQNKSNQTAEQLMEAMIGVGGTMKGLNIPVQDTATALGVMANRGIKGTEAGTALNAIMANLTTGTGQAGKMMQKLGISAFDNKGNFIGLEATLQKVNQATKGLTEEQRNAALAAIGGKQHIDALNDLLGGLNETNAEGIPEWQALNKELYHASEGIGALEEMRKIKLDNLEGDLSIFYSALDDAKIHIYKNLRDPLRGTTQFATAQIYRVSDALRDGGFTAMSETIGDVLADCLTEAANVAPQFVSVAGNMTQGFMRGMRDNAPALTSSAVQIGISALAGFGQFFGDFWQTGAVLLYYLAQGILSGLPQLTTAAVAAMQNFGRYLESNLPTLLQYGLSMILALSASLRSNAGRLADGAISLALSLARGLADSLPVIVSTVPTIVSNIAGVINDNAPKLLVAGVRIIATLALGLLRAIPVIVMNIPKIIKAIFDAFTAVNWLKLGGALLKEFANGILSVNWLQVGKDLIYAIINGVRSTAGGIWDAAIGFFTGGGKETAEATQAGNQTGLALAGGITDGLDNGMYNAVAAASNVGTETAAAVADGLNAGSGMIDSAVLGMSANLEQGLSGVSESAGAVWADIGISAQAGISEMSGGMTEQLDLMRESASESMSGLSETISGNIAAVGESVSTGAQSWNAEVSASMDAMTATADAGISAINSTAQTGFDAVRATAQADFNAVRTSIESEMSAAVTAVRNAVSEMKAAMNFTWKLPDLKTPKVHISGGFSLEPPTAPEFSVSWHKEGGILTGARIFGMQGNTLLGGGEAGREAVLPLSVLWPNMRTVVADVLNRYTEITSAPSVSHSLAQNTKALSALTDNRRTINSAVSYAETSRTGPRNATDIQNYQAFSDFSPETCSLSVTQNSRALSSTAVSADTVSGPVSYVMVSILPLLDALGKMPGTFQDTDNAPSNGIAAFAEYLDAEDDGKDALSAADLLEGMERSGFPDTDDNGNGDGFASPRDSGGSPVTVHITYSPRQSFYGDAPTKDDLTKAEKISQADFDRMMRRYMRDIARKRF